MGGELLAKFPHQMARIYHPIVTKFLYTVTPPIQWSGGVLCDLRKPGGAPTKTAGYREITVCDADAKPVLSFLRTTASPFLDASSPPGQYGGGCHSGSTASAHLLSRAFSDIAIAQGYSLVQLYVDVTTAFATMARALALPMGNQSDFALIERLSQFGFTNAEILDLISSVQDPARFVTTYGSQHLAEVLQSPARNSWMSSRYLNGVICPHSGTIAGTSIADLFVSRGFFGPY